jgi:hypothetical protein
LNLNRTRPVEVGDIKAKLTLWNGATYYKLGSHPVMWVPNFQSEGGIFMSEVEAKGVGWGGSTMLVFVLFLILILLILGIN